MVYSRLGEAVGISNGRVWLAFWKFLSIFMPRWEIWKVKWARIQVWRGVCGIGAMTRYEECCTMDPCGDFFFDFFLVFFVFILTLCPSHSEDSIACK